MKPKDVVPQLEQTIGITGAPRPLRAAIELELTTAFGMAVIEAAELAEESEVEVRDIIVANEETLPSPILTIKATQTILVEGTCYPNPQDTPELSAAKQHRLQIGDLLQAIRDLNFNDFELFGACVLRELGASFSKVTPQAGDQGIDFYGLLSLGQNSLLPHPFGRLAHDVQLRFAGQAKHYPNKPIGPELIRELVGAVSLARYSVYSVDHDLFDDLGLLPLNPLVSMFFTTGWFSSGALELAEKAGIIARSGEQLAVFLADKGVGMSRTKSNKVKFNPKFFRNWLDK